MIESWWWSAFCSSSPSPISRSSPAPEVLNSEVDELANGSDSFDGKLVATCMDETEVSRFLRILNGHRDPAKGRVAREQTCRKAVLPIIVLSVSPSELYLLSSSSSSELEKPDVMSVGLLSRAALRIIEKFTP